MARKRARGDTDRSTHSLKLHSHLPGRSAALVYTPTPFSSSVTCSRNNNTCYFFDIFFFFWSYFLFLLICIIPLFRYYMNTSCYTQILLISDKTDIRFCGLSTGRYGPDHYQSSQNVFQLNDVHS